MTADFLPAKLQPLHALALDLRGSSSAAADLLWSQVNHELWALTRNPWLILHTLSEEKIEQLAQNQSFYQLLQSRVKHQAMVDREASWFNERYSGQGLNHVGYFSMEFGLSEALPIYSGGLGLLAGDHLKASSDLGIPITGIGILYQQGYFRQTLDAAGKQLEFFPCNEPAQLPITRVHLPDHRPLFLTLSFPGRQLFLRVWKVKVGKVTLYLLDSNDLRNAPADRGITSELYGGGEEIRLQQELILAWGGMALLRVLKLNPDVYHLNEGHAAFVVLERCLEKMKKTNSSFATALETVRQQHLFTTHTPVAAGFDRFNPLLIESYFSHYCTELGLTSEELLALGRVNPKDTTERFNMAFLAARGSAKINGVSRVHGAVSRTLFAPLFPNSAPEKVPIGHVTNGVHIPSWESPETDQLWESVCGEKRWLGDLAHIERDFLAIPSERLWRHRQTSRQKLIDYVYLRLAKTCELDPAALTLGFSRRFASYKRVDLLLTDEQRFARLLTDTQRPIQLIIAGKAHPHDQEGKKIIERWTSFIRRFDICSHAVFLTDYDILLAQRLVQGIDVWINTPRFPWEASGTSGMKVVANGGLNLSELDGWWAEAYSPDVGWAIGDQKEHADSKKWDQLEARHLYTLLDEEVIPLYYERDEKMIPQKWLTKVKESMAKLTPRFSANRMVREYVETYYL
ncbi:MAG: alpha-glucan family phosphorylase [Chlamydiota bacterium]